MFKLAMVQMQTAAAHKEQNLQRASFLVKKAAANKARLAVLPEVCELGWTDPAAFNQAEPVPGGSTWQCFSQLAAETGIYLCAGLAEKTDNKIFNSAVLIDPQGRLLLKHRKINELHCAHDLYSQGRSLKTVSTALGCIGVMICADAAARDMVLSRSLAYMGAD
ncbi:MAG TPA: carbon-nitrogen hydrolase family protein, partial [Spirochaetota bacterium]|nr:carbon-nitrogen hydrolase family protein [Spirochaetota bacterium]